MCVKSVDILGYFGIFLVLNTGPRGCISQLIHNLCYIVLFATLIAGAFPQITNLALSTFTTQIITCHITSEISQHFSYSNSLLSRNYDKFPRTFIMISFQLSNLIGSYS